MSVSIPTAEDFEALRAELHAAIDRIAVLERERAQVVRPVADWMPPAMYAARCGFSPRKVAELIADGLPSKKVGRARRIDVAAADAWLASRGDS